jgi:hypothetical protein
MTKTERVTRRRILKDDRYHAALHEAAHAVAHIALGQSFICIRLCSEPAVYKDGREQTGTRLGQTMVDLSEILYGYEAIRDEAIANLVGLAFEKKMYPKASWMMLLYFMGAASNDYVSALNQAKIVCRRMRFDPEEYMMKEWFPLAVNIVTTRWEEIVKLGTALYEAGELSYVECVKHVRVAVLA